MNKLKFILYIILAFGLVILIYYCYPESKLPDNKPIDHLVVYKSKRQLLAFSDGQLIKTYKISLGRNPIGDKKFEGDKKTPEGSYIIFDKNPNSDYHKNLGISYPNQNDIKEARKLGKSTGGDIKIHGLRNGLGYIHKFQRWQDWTAGCIALTNPEIDELYKSVALGTKIDIKP